LLEQKTKAMKTLREKQEKTRNLLELLSSKRKGKESIRFLESLEIECLRQQRKIYKIDRLLTSIRPLSIKESASIVVKFHALIQRYIKYPEDHNMIRRLQKFIIRINITEMTNIDIDYDLEQILKAFR